MRLPRWTWGPWALGLVGIVAWRWPAGPQPPEASAVVCSPEDAGRLLAAMRIRMEALSSTLTAAGAGEAPARVAAAARVVDQDGPTGCRLPAGWTDLEGAHSRAWTTLATPEASADAVSQALADVTEACVTCHDAHMLVVAAP